MPRQIYIADEFRVQQPADICRRGNLVTAPQCFRRATAAKDESDDNHLYYLRWYALYSGRDASWRMLHVGYFVGRLQGFLGGICLRVAAPENRRRFKSASAWV